ncbi:hypothetical protein D3C76_993510 [compost metagenome]
MALPFIPFVSDLATHGEIPGVFRLDESRVCIRHRIVVADDVGDYSFQVDFEPFDRIKHQKSQVFVEFV